MCPCVRYAMPGTDLASFHYQESGAEIATLRLAKEELKKYYAPTRSLGTVRHAIRLRACYAMSSTRVASDAIRLRACYAMSGTEIPYAGRGGGVSPFRGSPGRSAIYLRACYAMSGTDIACA
eukprot:2140399-Rhodomonas_salina.2